MVPWTEDDERKLHILATLIGTAEANGITPALFMRSFHRIREVVKENAELRVTVALLKYEISKLKDGEA